MLPFLLPDEEAKALDKASREEWRGYALRMMLLALYEPAILYACVAGGRNTFLAAARAKFVGHAFHESDLVWIWDELVIASRVCQKIEQLQAARKPVPTELINYLRKKNRREQHGRRAQIALA